MAKFEGISFLVEPEGNLRHVQFPEELSVEAQQLFRNVHQSFLNSPGKSFRGEFRLPYHPKLVFDWETVGDTSGMVIWTKSEQLRGMSLFLNGLEAAREVQMIEAAMRRRGLPPPPGLWELTMNIKRPLLITIHADIRSVGDMMLSTVAPIMAGAFFSMFGTGDDAGTA